jgi:hypothetical protein
MRHGLTGVLMMAGVVALSSACGKSAEEKAADDALKAASAAVAQAGEAAARAGAATAAAGAAAAEAGAAAAGQAAAGAETAKGMEDFAKAMQGMAAALGGNATGKPSEPVSFRDLQTAFPTVAGWTMDKPRGERMTAPVAFSETEARYSNGSQEIRVKIVDSAFNQILVAPWAMFLSAGYEKETDDGYEKSTNVGGQPGFEKWDSSRKGGEVNLVVAKRFLVSVEGNDLNDVKQLHDFASKVDFGKLASLGAATAAR